MLCSVNERITKRVTMKLFVFFAILSSKLSVIMADCVDFYGKSITPNAHFIPGPDICQLCVCDNTIPKWCKRVLCSPPQNCKSFVMGSSCCDYSCLDHTLPNGELRDEIDRRFLITIATAFLILTILLFVIHKLRHRTIHERLQTRPPNEDRRSIGSIGFITGSIGYLNLPNAHNFEDHPIVHFPVYKPNSYYPRGEAPPPYDEAMADARLTSYAEIEMLSSNERSLGQDPNNQRRRNNQILNYHPMVIESAGNRVPESRPGENGVFVEDSAVSDNTANLPQHRTIPLPLCVNPEQMNNTVDSTPSSTAHQNNRFCSLHKKNNDFEHHRARANSTNQRRSCTSGSRPSTCPPQFHVEVASLGEAVIPQSHRALPLSASLSLPLPSTSDSNNQSQFAGIVSGPTSSSTTNICSYSNEDRTSTKPVVQLNAKKHHHKSCRRALQVPADVGDTSQAIAKCLKERRNKLSNSKEPAPTTSNKEAKEDNQEGCQAVGDYYAECENCNLTVASDGCDASDDYFSKQETMTLQRKLHEISVAQTMDKVSLTLPTNSRSRRRCSSKNRKCGRWNAKESQFKTTLEYVSSEDEIEEEPMEDSSKHTEGQELPADVPKNADEGV